MSRDLSPVTMRSAPRTVEEAGNQVGPTLEREAGRTLEPEREAGRTFGGLAPV